MYSMHVERTSSEAAPKLCGKAADIAKVGLMKKDGKKVRFLDLNEIQLLIEKATTPAVRIAALLGLNTGLRRANILGLEWKEVRLSKKTISLPAEKMKSGHPHTVDIPAHLVDILKKWRSDTRVTAFVFPDPVENAPISNFRTEWEKTMTACGFDDVTLHTLRHTFASQWLMSGGDLSTLSEHLDHSSIQITKDLYGHLSRDHKKKAIDNFAAAFLSSF
jgi:integrase